MNYNSKSLGSEQINKFLPIKLLIEFDSIRFENNTRWIILLFTKKVYYAIDIADKPSLNMISNMNNFTQDLIVKD